MGSENKKEESGRTVRIYAFGIVMARITFEFSVYFFFAMGNSWRSRKENGRRRMFEEFAIYIYK